MKQPNIDKFFELIDYTVELRNKRNKFYINVVFSETDKLAMYNEYRNRPRRLASAFDVASYIFHQINP